MLVANHQEYGQEISLVSDTPINKSEHTIQT